jgi:glucose/mannose transport system substrate-binding protein
MLKGARLASTTGPSAVKVGRAAVLALGLAVGCADEPRVELEVYSWWTQLSEAEAFERIRQIHQLEHPDVLVQNRAERNATDQRDQMAGLLLAGSPPATFTANVGADLLRWALVDTQGDVLPSESRIQDVSSLLRDTGLLAALPEELVNELRVGDSPEMYGVPINLHRLNVLYYNVDHIETHGEGRSVDDLLSFDTLCPATGKPDLPSGLTIAIGTNDDFALILLVFENLLPAIAGPDFYDALFRGEQPESVSSPGESYQADVRKAVQCAQNLAPYFVETGSGLSWSGAIELVRDGDASFTVMGDWASGELVNQLVSGDVVSMPFPGTENTFVYTSDTFPLPVGVDHEAEVIDLLRTIAGPSAQREFSRVKGSIPAWEGLRGLGELEDIANKTREDFDNPDIAKVIATSGRFPPYYQQTPLGDALQAALDDMAGAAEIELVIDEFESQRPLLESWQARVRSGARELRP